MMNAAKFSVLKTKVIQALTGDEILDADVAGNVLLAAAVNVASDYLNFQTTMTEAQLDRFYAETHEELGKLLELRIKECMEKF